MNKKVQKFRNQILLLVGLAMTISACSVNPVVREQNLTDGWKIISNSDLDADGKILTTQSSTSDGWVDARVPTTVLGALVEAGVYKDPFVSDNLDKIPGEQFEQPWWFRKEFALEQFNPGNEALRLLVDGINYRANIWLNGKQIASQDTLYGAFRQFEIEITDLVNDTNILAFEIIPPKPRAF